MYLRRGFLKLSQPHLLCGLRSHTRLGAGETENVLDTVSPSGAQALQKAVQQGAWILTIQPGTAPVQPEQRGTVSSAWSPTSHLRAAERRWNGDTYFRPSVHNINEVTSWIGFPDGLEHLLVLQAPCTKAGQGLAAPADGGLGERPQRHSNVRQLHPAETLGVSPEQRPLGSPTPHTHLGKHSKTVSRNQDF